MIACRSGWATSLYRLQRFNFHIESEFMLSSGLVNRFTVFNVFFFLSVRECVYFRFPFWLFLVISIVRGLNLPLFVRLTFSKGVMGRKKNHSQKHNLFTSLRLFNIIFLFIQSHSPPIPFSLSFVEPSTKQTNWWSSQHSMSKSIVYTIPVRTK